MTSKREMPTAPRDWRAQTNALIAAMVVFVVLAWHLAAVITTGDLEITRVDLTLRALVHGEPVAGLPGGGPSSVGLIVGVWVGLILLVALIPILWAWRPRGGRKKRVAEGLTETREVTKSLASGHGAGGKQLAAFARYQGRDIKPRAEDTGVIIAPPRKGKTAFFAVGKIIDTDGKIVATSTKLDIVRLTAGLRKRLGDVYIFDPSRIGWWKRPCHWDMVKNCEDGEEAIARAEGAVAAVDLGSGGNSDFFAGTAATILQCFLHAAALEGLTMREVMAWSRDLSDPQPLAILEDHPDAEEGWAEDLRTVALGKSDTIESTRMTLSLALKPLRTKRVLDRVCPSEKAVMFDPYEFVDGDKKDTLFLVSSGGKSSCAPLTTALASSIDRLGRLRSQKEKDSRLKISITWVLDEVANTAPLPDLPQMMTDGGGRNMPVWAIAQAWSQLVKRWGEDGAKTIWDSAGMKVLLGGSTEVDFLDRVSQLVGSRKVDSTTLQSSREGISTGVSSSLQTERIIEVSDLHEIPSGKAFIQFDSLKGAIVDLIKWWDRPDAKKIKESVEYVWNELEEHDKPGSTSQPLKPPSSEVVGLFEQLKVSSGIGEDGEGMSGEKKEGALSDE